MLKKKTVIFLIVHVIVLLFFNQINAALVNIRLSKILQPQIFQW